MPATVPTPSSSDGQSRLARAAHSASILGMNSAESGPVCKPARSLSWLVAMTTAMPIVKPSMTDSGISRISRPAPNIPPITSNMPAIMVAISSPSKPCLVMTV